MTSTPVSLAHYPLDPAQPQPDTTATDTAALAVAGQAVGSLERHTYRPVDGPPAVTYTVEIHAPTLGSGAAPIEADDPGLLDDIAAVCTALADELRRTR